MSYLLPDSHIPTNDRPSLRKFLIKIQKSELEEVLLKWGIKCPLSFNRPEIVEEILDRFPNGLNQAQLAQFDIRSHIQASCGKKWRAYELVQMLGENTTLIDPSKIKKRLGEALGPFFHVHVYMVQNDGCIWFRLCIYEGEEFSRKYLTQNNIVFCHIINTPYIISTFIKTSMKDIVFQAWAQAMESYSIKDLQLFGNNFVSIIQLLLDKDSQGPYSHYRLNQVDANPLLLAKEKYSAKAREQGEEMTADGIVIEHHEKVSAQKKMIKEVFGTNPLPSLHCLTGKLVTSYKGQETPLELESPINMRLTFKGKNISNGFRELVTAGFVKDKIANYLTDLGATNMFEYIENE